MIRSIYAHDLPGPIKSIEYSNDDGSPIFHRERHWAPAGSISNPDPATARALVEAGNVRPFVPTGELARLCAATLHCDMPPEAAVAGHGAGFRVWHTAIVRGELAPAPMSAGPGRSGADAGFREAEIVAHWQQHPQATPLFIIEDGGVTKGYRWRIRTLLEISI